MAAGTGFAIAYVSDISQVTLDNLVVFTVRSRTPWKRVTPYDVPAKMPPCPPGGCICAWGWIPNGCGLANMYMAGFKCKVTNSISNTPLAKPKPPVWCEGNPNNCTKGAKQFIGWHQQDGNNIQVDGFDLAGGRKSPGYNSKLGFSDGAQNDIFADSTTTLTKTPSNPPSNPPPASSPPAKSPPSNPPPATSPPANPPINPTVNPPTSGNHCKRTVDDDEDHTNIVKKSTTGPGDHWHRRTSRWFRLAEK